jgi:hypothetical protein
MLWSRVNLGLAGKIITTYLEMLHEKENDNVRGVHFGMPFAARTDNLRSQSYDSVLIGWSVSK